MGGGGEGDKVEAFLRWAAEMGVSDSPSRAGPSQSSSPSCLGQSLVLSQFPDAGGRGLAAARELRKGERVLRVPKDALLTSESVLKDEKLAVCVKQHPHLSSTQILAAEDAIWVSEKILSKVRSDWKEAIILMQEMGLKPQLLTLRSWLWASATVSSRALHVPWDKAGCLCPVGDFFNYAAPDDELSSKTAEAEASSAHLSCLSEYSDNIEDIDFTSQRLTDGGYEDDEAAYCFYARKGHKKGEQVLLCYGTYTNLELLEHYGFLLNVNPNDKAFIRLDADMYTSSSWPTEILYIQQDGRPSFALLSTLRLWATPSNLRRPVSHRAYSGLQLSVENEISVMRWLAERCQDVLKEMPTTASGDCSTRDIIDKMLECSSWKDCMDLLPHEGELKELFLSSSLGVAGFPLPGKVKRSLERFRLAVQWRLIYKRMLLDCIAYCRQVISMLSSPCASDKETN